MKLLLILFIGLFTEANERYAEQNYAEAIALYEQVITEEPSAEAYYNLCNAYFKAGELGKSILNYQRALRLRPRYSEARFNLRFAEARVIDDATVSHNIFIGNWAKAVRNLCLQGTWTVLSIVFFLLFLAMAMLYALARTVIAKKIGFHTAWVALLITLVSVASAASLQRRDEQRAEAVIMQGVVNLKSSPDKSGTDLFVLHEGTEVYIHETIGEWVEVSVGDNRGWMREIALERI